LLLDQGGLLTDLTTAGHIDYHRVNGASHAVTIGCTQHGRPRQIRLSRGPEPCQMPGADPASRCPAVRLRIETA
jgi:hypothetical protein